MLKQTNNYGDFEILSATVDYKNLSTIMLPDPFLLNYYDNLNDRILVLNSDVDTELIEWAKYIIQWNQESMQFGRSKEKATPIKIFINSDGGDIDSIFPIIDLIKASQVKVITIGLGKCFSAGALLLMAGDERYALPNTQILIHEGMTGYQGDVSKVADRFDFEKKIDERIKSYILSNSKISEEEYKNNIRKDWWMFADEAKDKGIIDDIITDISVITNM